MFRKIKCTHGKSLRSPLSTTQPHHSSLLSQEAAVKVNQDMKQADKASDSKRRRNAKTTETQSVMQARQSLGCQEVVRWSIGEDLSMDNAVDWKQPAIFRFSAECIAQMSSLSQEATALGAKFANSCERASPGRGHRKLLLGSAEAENFLAA